MLLLHCLLPGRGRAVRCSVSLGGRTKGVSWREHGSRSLTLLPYLFRRFPSDKQGRDVVSFGALHVADDIPRVAGWQSVSITFLPLGGCERFAWVFPSDKQGRDVVSFGALHVADDIPRVAGWQSVSITFLPLGGCERERFSSLHEFATPRVKGRETRTNSEHVMAPRDRAHGEAASVKITPYQRRVYALLNQIPAGRVSTYAAMSKALGSSPRAVGGALRRNPFAPRVPCHRVISAGGYVGGFMGDWQKAPSGINCERKLALLADEGVRFDDKGMLMDKARVWAGFRVTEEK
nr:methylated-dna--protein-cysteine methyltransferase [Quercus suber]